MHIVLFFTFDYSLKTWLNSGHITRELKLYDYLTTRGVEISFVTYGDSSDLEILKNSKIKIFPIYTISKKSKYKILNFVKSFLIPFKLKNHIDTSSKKLIIKQNQLLGSWVAIIFKIISGAKLYTRTGYDMYLFSVKEGKNLLKKIVYFLLTQITISFSDSYIVTSNSDAKFLKNRFLTSKKILVRPNWVDVPIEAEHERYSDRLLSVGRLEKQKNFEELILSAKKTGFKIDIYGEGRLKTDLEKLSKSLDIELNIFNNIENEELLNVYQKYKYFISTSNFEGNSKVILEAMANGCLVIAKDIENNREVLGDESGLLYNDNLNEVLIRCMNDEYDKLNILNNSRNTIIKYYSKDKIFSDYLSDFEDLYEIK
tara:strand:- start:3186 stop:4298 length:1113 start_codon:yes stop_codon:yes gene_type:complete